MSDIGLAAGPFELALAFATTRELGAIEPGVELEEITVLPDPHSVLRERAACPIRAFRIRGPALEGEGLQDGDCLLVERRTVVRPNDLVVTESNGRFAVSWGDKTGHYDSPRAFPSSRA
jgi:hypothetical protein